MNWTVVLGLTLIGFVIAVLASGGGGPVVGVIALLGIGIVVAGLIRGE